MTQPNPNNPSPEMIEGIARAVCWESNGKDLDCESVCMRANACRGTISECFIRDARAAYAAMQAQQPNPSPADELTTLQARLDAIRAELETGIANLHETLEGEEDRFWSRYWQGYLKAYESLLEKFGAISGDKA